MFCTILLLYGIISFIYKSVFNLYTFKIHQIEQFHYNPDERYYSIQKSNKHVSQDENIPMYLYWGKKCLLRVTIKLIDVKTERPIAECNKFSAKVFFNDEEQFTAFLDQTRQTQTFEENKITISRQFLQDSLITFKVFHEDRELEAVSVPFVDILEHIKEFKNNYIIFRATCLSLKVSIIIEKKNEKGYDEL